MKLTATDAADLADLTGKVAASTARALAAVHSSLDEEQLLVDFTTDPALGAIAATIVDGVACGLEPKAAARLAAARLIDAWVEARHAAILAARA